MDAIIAQIHALAKTSDEVGRLEIQRALRDVNMEIQSPKDLMYNLANSVSHSDVQFLCQLITNLLSNSSLGVFALGLT